MRNRLIAFLIGIAVPVAAGATDTVAEMRHVEAEAANDRGRFGSAGLAGLPNYSPRGFADKIALARARLARLATINRAILPHDMQISYDVVKWDMERLVEGAPFEWLLFPYTPYEWTLTGPNIDLQKFAFDRPGAAAAYLNLVERYPMVIVGLEAHLDGQEAHGIYLQRDAARGVAAMFAATAAVPPERSELWPDDARLAPLGGAEIDRFRARLRALLAARVAPALARFAARFDAAYLAKAPTRLGLAQYPGGQDYYRLLIRTNLTSDASPEELFAESQATLDRIESDLAALRSIMQARGTRADFEAMLRRRAPFAADTPDDVRTAFQGYLARIEPNLSEMFCRKPPFGYVIERASPTEETALTFGYADLKPAPRHFAYLFNGTGIRERSLLGAQPLIYHEVVPGHYMQIATQIAAGAPSAFAPIAGRYPRDNNAYQEAWAEYGARLAYERGNYTTLEQQYSRQYFAAMFPARALVDIGINYYGRDAAWGRAILRRYSGQPEAQIEASLRRDTTDWQAQILPYSLGEKTILRLREQAATELRDRFDLRRFNDAVLSVGAVPLPVLAKHVRWFIDQERDGRAPGVCTGRP